MAVENFSELSVSLCRDSLPLIVCAVVKFCENAQCAMADKHTPQNDSIVTDQPTFNNGHPQSTLLQSDKKADLPASGDTRRRRCGISLFTANAGCVIWLWMIGVVYTGGVVRTLERRFGLRSTQTGVIVASGDIVHMCIVIFIGYFGRRAHKPRIMCVTALFSAVGNFIMALPHWLYSSHEPTSSAFANDCRSCLCRQRFNFQLNKKNHNLISFSDIRKLTF